MTRAIWLLGSALLLGCSTPQRSISVAVNVEPNEGNEQYLFDVMIEEDGNVLAHPKLLVRRGQSGSVRIEQDGGNEVVVNVIAAEHDQESDP